MTNDTKNKFLKIFRQPVPFMSIVFHNPIKNKTNRKLALQLKLQRELQKKPTPNKRLDLFSDLTKIQIHFHFSWMWSCFSLYSVFTDVFRNPYNNGHIAQDARLHYPLLNEKTLTSNFYEGSGLLSTILFYNWIYIQYLHSLYCSVGMRFVVFTHID